MDLQRRIQAYMDANGMIRGQFASILKVNPYIVTRIMNDEKEVVERYKDRICALIDKHC